MSSKWATRQSGFTIVELLIVIVVDPVPRGWGYWSSDGTTL